MNCNLGHIDYRITISITFHVLHYISLVGLGQKDKSESHTLIIPSNANIDNFSAQHTKRRQRDLHFHSSLFYTSNTCLHEPHDTCVSLCSDPAYAVKRNLSRLNLATKPTHRLEDHYKQPHNNSTKATKTALQPSTNTPLRCPPPPNNLS